MIRKESTITQSFPESCRYSCSKNGEIRNFILSKESYVFEYWKIKFRFWQSIKVECSNCHWSATLPSSFAKKIFKHGLRANTLITYSHDRLLSSRALNFLGNLWRVWAAALTILIVLIIFRYYSQPVIVGTPKTVTVEEIQSGRNIGEIVKVQGKVDYTLALTKDDLVENRNGELNSITREVYLPIFSNSDITQFFVLRGGDSDVSNVLGRVGLTSSELLKNQDYSVTGKVEKIDVITNEQLKNFFTSELPKSKGSNPAKIVVTSVGIIYLSDFLWKYVSYFTILLLLLATSVYAQMYIDKKIMHK